MVDCGYSTAAHKLRSINGDSQFRRLNLVTKMESLDVSKCWNANVVKFFSAVDRTMANKSLGIEPLSKLLGQSK